MEDGKTEPSGPDLALGIVSYDLPDGGKLFGHVGEEQVLLARRGAEIFAIGAVCTHYSGPLGEGLIVAKWATAGRATKNAITANTTVAGSGTTTVPDRAATSA